MQRYPVDSHTIIILVILGLKLVDTFFVRSTWKPLPEKILYSLSYLYHVLKRGLKTYLLELLDT